MSEQDNTKGVSCSGTGSCTFTNADKKNGENPADNALSNASASANSNKETATITLRGYPLLKAKTTLEITGVGKGSGIWYCKTVIQQWSVEHGYMTSAQLTRGDGGGGGEGGDGGSTGGGNIGDAPTMSQ